MNLGKSLPLGTGALMLVIGIVLFAFPGFTMSLFTTIVGIGILVASISAIATWANGARDTLAGTATLALGIIGVLCAIACIFHPLSTASAITWLVCICVVVLGAAQLITMLLSRGMPGRGFGIVTTALVVVFGIGALLRPQLVVQFIGIALIVEGVSSIALCVMNRD